MSPRKPALAFRDLTLGYERRPAVHHLTATIREGDLVALVGPNGAGKSTLLNGVVGRAEVLGGAVDRCGRSVPEIGYLPQRAEIDAAFPISVHDFVAIGAWRRLGFWRRAGHDEEARIAEALARVSLGGFEARPIGTLSGGQLQRALFARTIVQDARVILLDEPFAAIDARTTADLLRVIARWHDEGRTVIAALHDFAQVRQSFPTSLLLARELIAFGATPSVLAPDNLARGSSLVEAWAEQAEHCHGEGGHHHHGEAGVAA